MAASTRLTVTGVANGGSNPSVVANFYNGELNECAEDQDQVRIEG